MTQIDAFGDREKNSDNIPTIDDLNSWFEDEEYSSPSKTNSCTRMLLANDYYFHENFGAAYFYAETVLNYLNFQNLKKDFGDEIFEDIDLQEWTQEFLAKSLTEMINELKLSLDDEEIKNLENNSIVISQNLEDLFEKHLPKNYRIYKMLTQWFAEK